MTSLESTNEKKNSKTFLTLSVPNDGYFRNASCKLDSISMIVLHSCVDIILLTLYNKFLNTIFNIQCIN